LAAWINSSWISKLKKDLNALEPVCEDGKGKKKELEDLQKHEYGFFSLK